MVKGEAGEAARQYVGRKRRRESTSQSREEEAEGGGQAVWGRETQGRQPGGMGEGHAGMEPGSV
jgi:hypothetical protein